MKVFWKEPQRLLQMEAESAAELRVVSDLLHGGPLAGAEWIKVPEDQLPFAREPLDGITTLIGRPCVVIGLVWDVDPVMKRNQVLQAHQATGQAVHHLLGLLSREMQVQLAQPAAGVAPIEGNLQVQPAA